MACNHASIPQPPKGGISKHAPCGKGEIKFYSERRELLHNSGCPHLEEKVSLAFRMQKNGVKNATTNQWHTGKHLFLVQVWPDIVTRLDSYPGLSDNTPLKKVWVKNYKTNIMSQITTISLRSVTLSFKE